MLNPIKQTILYDQNAIYYGYPIERLMEKAGRGIARVLLKKYGKGRRIGFFCGPGNNGGDGLAAARYLEKSAFPEVYLIPPARRIRTPEARKNWDWWRGFKKEKVGADQIPDHFDVVVECLFGTGLAGRVRQPYASVIRRINRLKGKKVSIDLPAPGFKAGFVISMMFKKASPGVAVDIGYPDWLKNRIGVGQVKVLTRPATGSRKGQNGKLLIVGGSADYHGAPLLAARIAAKIADLVYFSSTPGNNALLPRMKKNLAEFIAVPRENASKAARQADAVLIGPGLETGSEARQLTNMIMRRFPGKKIILDAGALKVLDKRLLHENCLLTPHRGEFKTLFALTPTKGNTLKMAKKYRCLIALKGVRDYLSDGRQVKINSTGNAGLTKGGTGDVLAGLIAGLAARDDLFLAAAAGLFINGLAGDRLQKKMGYYYSAGDLIREIPKTIKWSWDY